MSSTMRCFFIMGVLVAIVNVCHAATDECLGATPIGDPRRDPKNRLNLQGSAVCDAFRDNGTWYRFTSGDSEGQLPESCVEILHCGTYAPIWMSGSHPTETNPGPVTRTVCAQYWSKGNCCAWSDQVRVKWCRNSTTEQEYYVYRLAPPPVCSMAYCANITSSIPKKTLPPLCSEECAWNNVLSQCSCPKYPSMTDPVMSTPYISESQQVTGVDGRPFTATKFSLSCTAGYQRQTTDDGARFSVQFYVNDRIIKTFEATSANPIAVISESEIRGILGTHISCTVSSFWNSSNPELSARRSSNDVFVGIIPIDDSGRPISRIDMQENQEFNVRMMATFPITSAECFDSRNVSCEANYTFDVSANNQTLISDCSFYLTPSKTVSDVIKIKPIQTIGTRVAPFNWQLDFNNQTNSKYSNTIYYGYKIQSIPVTIEDSTPRPMCSSTGDPHITTFGTRDNPKKTYNMYLLGDYVLVNYTYRTLEIQVRQFPCNGGSVACNCGVMIREGNNILGVDSCPRSSSALDWTPKIIQTLSDQASHGMTISQTGSGWTINLISGIQVNVDRGWTTGVLDIHVIGIAAELSNYGGLCSYNGNQIDNCTSDCEKYRVERSKSFFEYRLQDLPKCKNETYTAPTCNCKGRNSDSSISVGCTNVFESYEILGPFYTCKISRRKRSVPQPLRNPIDLDTLYNYYCPTLQLKPDQPLREPNRQVAIQKCTDALKSSDNYQTCHGQSNLDETPLINSCATDYQISGDLSVTISIKTQLERFCVHAIESSINERSNGQDKDTENLLRKLRDVKAKICPQQCSQQGICSNSVCQCYSGFIGSDCSLRQGQTPYVVNNLVPLCDLQKKSCEKVFLEAINISSVTTLSCRLRSDSGQVWYDAAPNVSGGVVICSFPSLTSVGTYFMSLSNDRSAYSSEIQFDLCDSGTGQCISSTSTTTTTSTTSPRTTFAVTAISKPSTLIPTTSPMTRPTTRRPTPTRSTTPTTKTTTLPVGLRS